MVNGSQMSLVRGVGTYGKIQERSGIWDQQAQRSEILDLDEVYFVEGSSGSWILSTKFLLDHMDLLFYLFNCCLILGILDLAHKAPDQVGLRSFRKR